MSALTVYTGHVLVQVFGARCRAAARAGEEGNVYVSGVKWRPHEVRRFVFGPLYTGRMFRAGCPLVCRVLRELDRKGYKYLVRMVHVSV